VKPEFLAAIAGGILSLLMNYVPGLKDRFDRLSANGQRAAMAGLLLVAAVLTPVWSCWKPEAGGLGACLRGTDWQAVLQAYFYALVSNQSVDRISPKKRDREAEAAQTLSPNEIRAREGLPPLRFP